MSEPLELLPEGCVLNGTYEVWRHVGAVPAGHLYLALTSQAGRPARHLLLARAADAPADLRQPGQRRDAEAIVPGLLTRFEAREQALATLDVAVGTELAALAPIGDDESLLTLVATLGRGLAELQTLGASAAPYRLEHLMVQPDGRLRYLGPVVAREPGERSQTALYHLIEQLADAHAPWSEELTALLGRLREPMSEGEFASWVEAATAADEAPTVTATVGIASDTGPYRQNNEDAAAHLCHRLAADPGAETLDLAAVADGVGGHRAGDTASRVALTTFGSGFMMAYAAALLQGEALCDLGNRAIGEAVASAFGSANETVSALAQPGEESPPGTTLVAAVRVGRRLFIGNLGDSRGYLLRERLERLTKDDSVVQRMVDRGELTIEETYGHPQAHAVTQCLGRGMAARPSLRVRLVQPGDRILLCSDGVSEVLRDAQLQQLLRTAPDAEAAAMTLVAKARAAGSRDNATALVIEITGA